MTHTPETLKAANDFSNEHGPEYKAHVRIGYLAGYDYCFNQQKPIMKRSVEDAYDHRQKEIDELVEALESTLPVLEANGYAIKANSHRKLIQKHKR